MRLILILLCLGLMGCASAIKSEDGNKMQFYGFGSAVFEDGSKIESKTPLPELPPLKMEYEQ